MIYLDNAATSFPKPEMVYEYVDWVQRNIAVNTGRGSYKTAREADEIIQKTRMKMAGLFGITSTDAVFFTPSATIAANEIIGGLDWNQYKNVYVTPFEHNAIIRPLHNMVQMHGCNLYIIPFDPLTQELDEEETIRLFGLHPPDYVFINHVSNVTGVVLPVDRITDIAKRYDAIVVVDGSQSIVNVDIKLSASHFDYLVFAGHKNLYASWGVGGYVKNSSHKLKPFLAGGTGSDSLNLSVNNPEVGSQNIIAIASLYKSIEWMNEVGIKKINDHKCELTRELIEGLRQTNAVLYLPGDMTKHTSVVSFNIPDYEPSEIGMILDEDFDIAVRTGYHCAPFVHRLINTEKTKGTVRVSVGYFNTSEDIHRLVSAIKDI